MKSKSSIHVNGIYWDSAYLTSLRYLNIKKDQKDLFLVCFIYQELYFSFILRSLGRGLMEIKMPR